MLSIKYFTFNPFAENTYLLYNEFGQALLIDPGMYHAGEDKILFDFVDAHNLKVEQIVNTHCHLDHVFGVYSAVSKYNVPFSFHHLEQKTYEIAPAAAERYGVQIGLLPPPSFLLEAQTSIQIGAEELTILFTPGHSEGHICLYNAAAKVLIAGDTLFDGSIGRTDLPGGDFVTLENSIRCQLYTLPDDTKVYCGHGGPTTIGKEKRTNPFVRA